MQLDNEIQKLISELGRARVADVRVGGATITAKVFDDASKLSLSTPVYNGGNFIPKSVRQSLKGKVPFDELRIETTLDVNEDKFQIILNYKGDLDSYRSQKFIDLLEEFSFLAERWRDFLDEQDKNDLIYIPVK